MDNNQQLKLGSVIVVFFSSLIISSVIFILTAILIALPLLRGILVASNTAQDVLATVVTIIAPGLSVYWIWRNWPRGKYIQMAGIIGFILFSPLFYLPYLVVTKPFQTGSRYLRTLDVLKERADINTPALSESEIQQRLQGESEDLRTEAINYVFQHPDSVHPFTYAYVAVSLVQKGNRAQGAFWFYVFQSRSRAWVVKDKDLSGLPALRSALNQTIGNSINEWIASDIGAWQDLAERAISYEEKLPLYKGKPDYLSEEQWQDLIMRERTAYKEDFTKSFEAILSDNGEHYLDQRRKNGLYVGSWQKPGEPLPEEWR